jgi:hypothetical protein
MAFSIGRAGKTLLLNDPSMWAESNGQITVTVISTLSSVTDALRLRDQLLGYQDNLDEAIVPVVVDSEPRLTGYYRIIPGSVQIDTDPLAVGLGTFTAYITLERVMGFTQPLMESIISGALLPNGVGGLDADAMPFHAVPGAATEYQSPLSAGAASSRLSAAGLLTLFSQAGSSGYGGIGRHAVTPQNFYVGAATFKQGNPLQPVVGRLMAQADVLNWELGNDLIRITPNATPGKLDVSRYKGAAWSTPKTYALQILNADSGTDDITTGGSILASSGVLGVLTSFKPAAGSTIARVGAIGAFTIGTNTAVTPAYGQATVAGHLLVAVVTSDGTGTTTTAAGWAQAQVISSIGQVAIWYKKNCGAGEAAPTFTSTTGSTPMHAQLTEFSGAHLTAPLDQISPPNTQSDPVIVRNGGIDVGFGDLVVMDVRWRLAGAATATFLDTFNNGAAAVHMGDSGGSSLSRHSSFSYGITAPTALTGLNSVTVLRNSVEEAVIRLSLATSGGPAAGLYNLDLRLRRGDLLVRLYATTTGPATLWKLARDTAEAATAITFGAVTLGGIRATADDADGLRYVMLTYETAAPVSDLVNGVLTQGALSTTADFGIGASIGSAGVPDDPTSLAQQYLAAQAEAQRVVAR